MNNFGVNSSFGFGSAGGGGGGGGVTGANNGLSLDGTDVQLGGNPLIQDTEIELGAFDLDLMVSPIPVFSIHPTAGLIRMITPTGYNASMTLDGATGISQIGDTVGFGNTTKLLIDDDNQTITGIAGGADYLFIDRPNKIFQFGDIDNSESSYIELNSLTPSLEWFGFGLRGLSLSNDSGVYQMGDIDGSNMVLEINTPTQKTTIANPGGATFLLLDAPNDNFQIGDLSGTGTGLIVRTSPATASISMGGNNYLNLNAADGLFGIGDLSNVVNSTKFLIDDVNKIATIEGDGGIGLSIDMANRNYQMGDTTGVGNGGFIEVDDSNELVLMSDNNGNSYAQIGFASAYMDFFSSTGGVSNAGLYFEEGGGNPIIELKGLNSGGITMGILMASNLVTILATAGVKTSTPNGPATDGAWKLGKVITAASVLDAARYVEVNIDGAVVKLAVIQ